MKWIKSGAPWIWLTAGAVSMSLFAVLGLLLLIGWKGLSYFWPAPLYQFQLDMDGQHQIVLGQIYDRQDVPVSQLPLVLANNNLPSDAEVERLLIKIANRDTNTSDFISVLSSQVIAKTVPQQAMLIERRRDGDFYGFPVGVLDDGERFGPEFVTQSLAMAEEIRAHTRHLENEALVKLNQRLVESRQALARAQEDPQRQQRMQEIEDLSTQLSAMERQLLAKRSEIKGDALLIVDGAGVEYSIAMSDIIDSWYPNQLSGWEQLTHWLKQMGKFVSENPRDANTEGGVFPAIFGTVLMVLLMSVMVTPFGVIAAIYLNEYAKNNAFTRLIRIAVINLAGVPSIVYGVFGLGFFVYVLGASIDDLFYAETLPVPTYGTPGILWSALTLAILTLPVVIVSTEEGLSRVPQSVREGSLALGATQFETLWRIVLPMASPAIMTGLILAIARAAGEVAPLMLVGVVKIAPSLPIDGSFPYLHLDRKFMHLGYHIYDVGFQSSNIEAARPLVYATSFLLVLVIVSLNLTAIGIRNHLRDKYRSLEHG
uniref:phosphate ABC transporter permease PstA n=1 Tax=Thaumasiovibrio occultus TaxID=1891184 RepID=UPI0018650AD7|nr:phosphate ABC transporter permease PstA [Thaumasiovibrio occultus]